MTSRPRIAPAPALALAFAAAGAGCPPAEPPRTPSADPETDELVHAWRVDTHLLGKHTSMLDEDAARHRGSAVRIGKAGYATPWHGTCEESGRARRERLLAEVTTELAIDRPRVLRLGFTDPLVEYRLYCNDPDHRVPALTVFVANARALTCFGGICYVLVH